MAYSQYSEHRRPTAVPKVQRVEHYDATGEIDLRTQKAWEKAMETAAGPRPKEKPPAGKRSFDDLLKKKK